MKRPITSISFDADGTLWDFVSVMQQSLASTLAELQRLVPGPKTAALTIDQLVSVRAAIAAEMEASGCTLEALRLAAFTRTLEQIGHPDSSLAAHLTAFYLERRFADIALYPDVVPALDALRGAYRLGLLSNGNSYPARCGLTSYFDFIVFAQDHGVRKPDPAFYQVALQHAGVDADELIHVGDSLTSDVLAAQAMGIHALWLNRLDGANEAPPPTTSSVIQISSLAELPPLLAHLNRCE